MFRRFRILSCFMVILTASILLFQNFTTITDHEERPISSYPQKKTECSQKQLDQLFEPVKKNSYVVLNCSTRLSSHSIVAREVRFLGSEGSNSILDCQGATLKKGIRINSKRTIDSRGKIHWRRPENILVKNCKIFGGIRVSGIKEIGGEINHPDLLESARTPGHTIRTQNAAPKNIRVENSVIEATGGAPIYIDGGTLGFSLINSTINGYSNTDGMYLDAESAYHVVSGNTFNLNVSRAIIAIDGAALNKIENNKFNGLRYAGIWVFRNCGEKGLVRHQTPYNNVINGNVFTAVPNQVDPDIWVGSRNKFDDDESFCWQDKNLEHISNFSDLFKKEFKELSPDMQLRILKAKNYEVGSSKNNFDMAKNNIVTNNLTSRPIKTSVSNFVSDNQSPKVIRGPFYKSCQAEGNNEGCMAKFICPNQGKIQAVKVACNLETVNLRQRTLNIMGSDNKIMVTTKSKTEKFSFCEANDVTISSGKASLDSLLGEDTLRVSCKDKESNGGDCAVRAEVYCSEQEIE